MNGVFGPDWGNPSLRTIVEAEFPDPISLMPSTPGWWILLLALVGLCWRALRRRRQRYLRDRYRRDALAQLATIRERLAAESVEAARELAPLLRATAIEAAGRDQVSGLQGEAYADALAELAPGQDRVAVTDLEHLAYAPLDNLEGMDMEGLMAGMESWIRQHRGSHA